MNNFEMMRKRLEYQGGVKQDSRMIRDKYKTFLKALKYSYQAADSYKVGEEDTEWRILMNPNKLKQDYDDKIISVDYESGYNTGDIIKWIGTSSYWIIYLRELTEDGYFRGDVRRCRYTISWMDEEGITRTTWAAIRGPVETKIQSIQKHQISVDNPNLSLNILMPLTEHTKKAFERYDTFIFSGLSWRVQAPDWISMENVLEINAEEFFYNKEYDDMVDEIANGLKIAPVDPNGDLSSDIYIEGDTFIKPLISQRYEIVGTEGGKWQCKENAPVCIIIQPNNQIEVRWQKSVSGQFTLQYKIDDDIVAEKVIVVESLF